MNKRQKVNPETKTRKLLPGLLTGIALALFFAIAMIFRTVLPYAQIVTDNTIKFSGNDAYYQMRLVEYIVNNFPHLMSFDPYLIYPGGQGIGDVHFFNYLLASITWLIGLGSPSPHLIDMVGIYFPAVLGALTIIPVYFIGKALMGRWVGLIAAGLLAIFPGEFLGRSILGFTDNHIAETLFTTITMLFLLLAIKAASQRKLTFSHFKREHWSIAGKPLLYSLLAGLFLGIYMLTWLGSLLFVFLISLYFVIQFIIDHLRGKSTDYLCLVNVFVSLIALILFLPASPSMLYTAPTVIALLIPLVLNGISRLMKASKMKPYYYPLAILVLGLAAVGIIRLSNPSLFNSMLASFSIFAPTGVSLTTIEAQPLLPLDRNFFQTPAWVNFTTSFFFSLICLAILIYQVIRKGNAEKNLLVVWSLVILIATLGQRRFGYYFAVNATLLTGYLAGMVLSGMGLFKGMAPEAIRRPRRIRRQGLPANTINQVNMGLAIVIVLLLVFLPLISPAVAVASGAPYAPSNAWCESLAWLKDNSPEPYGSSEYYYHLKGNNTANSSYGVMAWWDYGYWITRIAHRIPNANPSQDPTAVNKVANYFTSQNETSADAIAHELGTKYVIIDYEVAYIDPRSLVSKFPAVTQWAGKQYTDFFDVYWITQAEQQSPTPIVLYHPEYYRSLSTRLYSFNGTAVTPQTTIVVSYQEQISQDGSRFKMVTSASDNMTYEEAEAYIASQTSGNATTNSYRIVGTNPFASPVPLEALEHYKLIYNSANITLSVQSAPEIKIFEYTG